MRRFLSMIFVLALALPLSVQAASVQMVRTFVQRDTLYTYVDITGAESPITKAEASVDGQTFPASGTLETVRQAGFPVTWMLLVDNSNSMPPFRQEAIAFAEGMAAGGGENTRFLLASFGDQFTLLAEDVPADQLAARMAKIPMDETVTRLHSSISQAMDYFDTLPRTGNELRGLIVLSDAVAYDPGASVSYQELLERINGSDVMLHSVGFGTDAAALENLASLTEASGGLHQVVEGDLTAGEAATALTEAAGSLYVTSFALSGFRPAGETAQVSVTFASGGELVCRGTAEVSFPAEGEAGGMEEPEPLPPSQPETGLPPADPGPAEEGGSPEIAQEPDGFPPTVLLPVIGVIIVAAVVAAVLLLRRKKTSAAPGPQPAQAADAPQTEEDRVYLRLEILQGSCLRHSLDFTLRQELVVGRDPDCDIPFTDSSVSRRHCRIFLAHDVVYIEDLDSQNGTLVNGSRIEMARVLRSGDEIQAGEVRFRLKF